MKTNQAGIDLIKHFEGCRLAVYHDPVGIPTVGYGHVVEDRVGTLITQAQADLWLVQDLEVSEKAVSKYVATEINENQFAALVSFTFNLGSARLRESTLLKFLNMGHPFDAANEFLKWTKAGGVFMPGLLRRRIGERALFLRDIDSLATQTVRPTSQDS